MTKEDYADQIKYPHLFLREWPFQTVPSPSFHEVWAGRHELKRKLIEMFDRVQQRSPSAIYLLWGFFGAGKTHSLAHFRWRLSRDRKNRAFVGYHEFPVSTKGLVEIYKGFMNGVDFQEIERVVKVVCDDLRKRFKDGAMDALGGAISQGNEDFANAIAALAEGRETTTIRRWMKAERVHLPELRRIPIAKRIESDEDVVYMFGALVRLMTYDCDRLSTFKCVIWMIDDFHEIGQLKEKYSNAVNHGLTSIFNNCPERFCLVLAFTSRSVMAIRGLVSDALFERLPWDPYAAVSPLSKEEAGGFILDLLKQFRSDKTPPDEFFPFSRESIERIVEFTAENTMLLPRDLMRVFSEVLDKAEPLIKAGKLERIEPDYSAEILREKRSSADSPG